MTICLEDLCNAHKERDGKMKIKQQLLIDLHPDIYETSFHSRHLTYQLKKLQFSASQGIWYQLRYEVSITGLKSSNKIMRDKNI